jgi:hypothetical protein
MGPSQGKHSNMNALRVLARATGSTPGEVGTTTGAPSSSVLIPSGRPRLTRAAHAGGVHAAAGAV